MRRWATWLILAGAAGLAAVLVVQWRERFFGPLPPPALCRGAEGRGWIDCVAWIGSPGALSAAHAELSTNCGACHVPFRRVADSNCLGCHARSTDLLTRRDTAFHAAATRCITCHLEHLGRTARVSRMDHAVLNPDVACTACHVDRHQTYFGDRCAECHGLETWRVAGFRHPPPRSKVCTECHAAPPSHYMMHFQMVDVALTRQRGATVDQCWRCHTTDHWNNIKGVGFYKHH
jgi:hypothetical protein